MLSGATHRLNVAAGGGACSDRLQAPAGPRSEFLGLAGRSRVTSDALIGPPAVDWPGTLISMEDLAGLRGLETVQNQLQDVIAVLRAERARGTAGPAIRRPAWKNLVFAGGLGTGKSRAAVAVGKVYRELGVLTSGHVIEAAAADLAGTGPGETGALLAEAIRPAAGGVLVVTAAHTWHHLPDQGQQVFRRLYDKLTEYRNELGDDLAVILAGQAGPLLALLHASPALAARFQAVIDFPGYTPQQLTEIFAALADEAALTLTPGAARKAAAVLARAEGYYGPGNARLAVALLNHVTGAQARRVITARGQQDHATLATIVEADIPDQLKAMQALPDETTPGQSCDRGRQPFRRSASQALPSAALATYLPIAFTVPVTGRPRRRGDRTPCRPPQAFLDADKN